MSVKWTQPKNQNSVCVRFEIIWNNLRNYEYAHFRLNKETSSLNVIFNYNCSYISYMLLQHLRAKFKLPTWNSEEPFRSPWSCGWRNEREIQSEVLNIEEVHWKILSLMGEVWKYISLIMSTCRMEAMIRSCLRIIKMLLFLIN